MDFTHLQASHEQQILQCQTKSEASCLMHERRSANYKPNIWKYDFLASLNSKYHGGNYRRQCEKLIEDVKKVCAETEDLLAKLELIDSIQKLGLMNHFENEIKEALDTIASVETNSLISIRDDLYATSLYFKILRQHGYKVSSDAFGEFMDIEKATLKKIHFCDVKGMLELLEASNLGVEGENILDEAKASTMVRLRDGDITCNVENNINYRRVVHAMELSSHRRVPWFDVRWQINAYTKGNHVNTNLLELAKLNFNIVQAALQKDLKEASMWWNDLGLTKKMDFARDRLVECFTCAVGLGFQPQQTSFRLWITKVVSLILIVDDVYDVYGSLEELRCFTNAVDRWDDKETEQLPECMKTCFQVLYNTTCEIAHEIEEKNGWNLVLPHLHKVWADFCKALLVEAEWYNKGYTPSLQEYLSNGCISSSVSVLMVHAFFSTTQHEVGTKEMVDFLNKNEDLVYNISLIVRLTNDLGTSVAEQERGDAPSSILCYMREVNASEETAQMNIKAMIDNTWKKINGQCLMMSSLQVPYSLASLINIATNMARVAHNLYQDGDGFGDQEQGTARSKIHSLLVEPYL